jgi:hypothetical protein
VLLRSLEIVKIRFYRTASAAKVVVSALVGLSYGQSGSWRSWPDKHGCRRGGKNPGICWLGICVVEAAAMNMSLVVFRGCARNGRGRLRALWNSASVSLAAQPLRSRDLR